MRTRARWGWDTWILIGLAVVVALGIALSAPFQTEVCNPAPVEGQENCAKYQAVAGALLRVVLAMDLYDGFVVGLFTIGLFAVAFQQQLLLRSQHELERANFHAVHRPRVKLRKVYTAKATRDGPTLRFEVELADTGYGGATIHELRLAFLPTMRATFGRSAHARVSELKAALDNAPARGRQPIPKGGSVALLYDVTDADQAVAFLSCDALYAVGYIVYGNDASDQTYRLGFIRVLRPVQDWTFREADIPDFEYSD